MEIMRGLALVLIVIGALGVIDVLFLRGALGVWASRFLPWNK